MKKSLWIILLLLIVSVFAFSACDSESNSQLSEKNHVHSFGEWKTIKDATCTLEGEQERICSCGEKEIKSLALIPHTEVIDEAISATCTAEGKTEGKHCSVCNTITVAQTTVKAKGHTEVTDKAVPATCTAEGKTAGKHCTVCNTIIVEQTTVKAKGHTEVTDKAVSATCTIDGKTEGKHCSVCNTVTVAQTAIKAKGHTEVTDKAVSPTCTIDGKTEGKHCSVCNTVTVAPTIVKAKGHTEVIDQAVAATCTKTGLTEGKHCTVCNTVTIAQTTVPATHQYKDATCDEPMKCTQCGQTYGLAEGHSFNGSYCSSCGGYLYDIFNYTYYSGSSIIGDRNYTYGTATITGCSKTYYKYNNSLTLTVSVKGTISAVYPGTSGTAHYKVCLYKDGVLVESKSASVTGKKGASSTSSVTFYNVTPGNYEIKIVKN